MLHDVLLSFGRAWNSSHYFHNLCIFGLPREFPVGDWAMDQGCPARVASSRPTVHMHSPRSADVVRHPRSPTRGSSLSTLSDACSPIDISYVPRHFPAPIHREASLPWYRAQ